MSLSKQKFENYVKNFQFRELFNEMGWNNDRTKQTIAIDEDCFQLQGVAEKSGFKILVCDPIVGVGLALPDKQGQKGNASITPTIPNYNTRKKIETKITKLFQEHIIIYHDFKNYEQIWQSVVRQAGKPLRITETRYNVSQSPELLYQRASGLFFTLDEEEKITIIDVTKRVAENLAQNNERVTKQFYDKFKKEHACFLDFIQGIDDKLHKDWYASLMLNRLMFCYFIQKKGFLDNNKNYLKDKLKECKEGKILIFSPLLNPPTSSPPLIKGVGGINSQNNFYSFYRSFLIALFHQGLGSSDHSDELKKTLGRIPYLNGGLFDEHEIERQYKNIDINDEAFELIFDFFDQYEWHLDTRINATGRDINPDVLGYIFEKYINDRAQMGAYYTKEDITEYISKNCIIPYLFDQTKRNSTNSLNPPLPPSSPLTLSSGRRGRIGEIGGFSIWQMLKESEDKYIYDAVKYGIQPPLNPLLDKEGCLKGGVVVWHDLPENIKAGLDPDQPDLVKKRKCWNTPAPPEIALPTEIWREVIERRKRYLEVRTKIENGEITEINDFITYNLNIRQFAQDVIENTNDSEFIRHFYKALNSITILDPTCGSGAFLFAAMNILEVLYEACIMRMDNFVAEAPKGKFRFFEEVLARVKVPEHPNLQYFIYKSIILCNLYGVDIMKEAVEIAKLRLFLKLVATVDADYRKPNIGLEPLPDIDFNIRSGNTLIGFANKDELENAFVSVEGLFAKDKLMEQMDIVARAFKRYKEIQLTYGEEYTDFKKAKDDLIKRLKELNSELNQ